MQLLQAALKIVASVPQGAQIAVDLARRRLRFDARLTDRAQTTMLRTIVLGPEPFHGEAEWAAVSLAGTLVHEHWHTRQNPLWKSWSFWAGILTRTHPMLRYEQPAYARQIGFLEELARVSPAHTPFARAEAEEVRAAFALHYRGELM
ncbi:MAG: hypothetical protein ABIY70_15545 [Capsulimonas sp.]|uniref:hypothetical protein n=1 Tax=Capsulimonas sp. TaxID=2494211 RepID=UPI003266447A